MDDESLHDVFPNSNNQGSHAPAPASSSSGGGSKWTISKFKASLPTAPAINIRLAPPSIPSTSPSTTTDNASTTTSPYMVTPPSSNESEGATPNSTGSFLGKYAPKFSSASSRRGSGHMSSFGDNEGRVDGAGSLDANHSRKGGEEEDGPVWKMSSFSTKITSLSQAMAAQVNKLDSLVETSLFDDAPPRSSPGAKPAPTTGKSGISPFKNVSSNNLQLARAVSDDAEEEEEVDQSTVSCTSKSARVAAAEQERLVKDMVQDVSLSQAGNLLLLTLASTNRPLLSLDLEQAKRTSSSLSVAWSRLHLHESYWKSPLSLDQLSRGGGGGVPEGVITHEEALSEMGGALYYTPSLDDVGTIIQCRVSALQGTPSKVMVMGHIEEVATTKATVVQALNAGQMDMEARLSIKSGGLKEVEGKDWAFSHEVTLMVTSNSIKIEAINADTPRGFTIPVSPDIKVRIVPNESTSFIMTLPLRDGSISYYGDKSGELANYLTALCPNKEPTRGGSSSSDGDDDDDDDDDDIQGDQLKVVKLASFRVTLPNQPARDSLACFTRVMVSEKLCMDPQHTRRNGQGSCCPSSLPWFLSEAARKEMEARKAAEERAQLESLQAQLTKEQQEREALARLSSQQRLDLDQAQARVGSLQEALDQARQQAAASEGGLTKTKEAWASQSQEVDRLSSQLSQLQEEHERAKVEWEKKVAEASANLTAQEDVARLKTEVSQWKKKSESLSRELKNALGGARGGEPADKGKVKELEEKLEMATQERNAFKRALEQALQDVAARRG